MVYASFLNLYNKRRTGDDRIRGEYRPAYAHTPLAINAYESEWGNNPEQARLVREFMWGVGEVVACVFCITVGNVVFGIIGFGVGVDGVNRIFSSLNSLWTNHQTELQALKMWEQTALKPTLSSSENRFRDFRPSAIRCLHLNSKPYSSNSLFFLTSAKI